MELTHRMRQILDLLLRSPYDITVAEIARRIGVSSRTVHRELDSVESYLHRSGILLRRKAGSGLGLEGEPEKLEQMHSQLQAPDEAELSADERQIYLLGRLLGSRDPVKLFTLANEMKVTVSTVSTDLDELTEWIGKQGLLLIRRRGYGVEITGPEPAMREAIRALLRLRLDDLSLIAIEEGRLRHPVDARVASLAGTERIPALEEVLWQWEEEQHEHPLSEEAYTDLLLRLSITAQRIGLGHAVTEAELLTLTSRKGSSDLASLQALALNRLPSVAADMLCRLLEQETKLVYSTAERRYASFLLDKAAERSSGAIPAEDLELAGIVQRLILKMEAFGDSHYSSDRSLRDGLYAHLKPALERIGAGQRIRNPLLDAVRKDYAELFAQVRSACDAVLPGPRVPEEEVAFLVMHFGSSCERQRQVRQDLRAIIVCTSGIGSSKMLAMRLGKEFPHLKMVQQASWYEASRIPASTYDLIISTVDLPLPQGQYIKLSPLLSPAEADRLREFMRGRSADSDRSSLQGERLVPLPEPSVERESVRLHKRAVLPEADAASGSEAERAAPAQTSQSSQEFQSGGTEALHSLSRAVQQCVSLLDRFRVIKLPAAEGNLEVLLLEACSREELREAVLDPSVIAMQLIQREMQGTQLIPGTDLALFHTRSELVAKPVLMLFELEQALDMKENDAHETEDGTSLKRFLLMLAPRTLNRESLEVLSEISATLLDQAMIDTLATGKEQVIRKRLAAYLTAFLDHKLESE
ncbi:BglG family transcription antiterminator [Paenibacillus herberti]|uniref:Sugar transporter n=1 Tax=Paenibacillus herberti TaxID=1619309 RepID=A0A229P4Q5_9BACL|nr:BglG family transcription antiterminator [Paenibacillus herberti]OXM17057.1 sugar transporter [Paenibacillus herberti]